MNIHYVGGEKEEGCGAAIWRNNGPKLKLERGRVIDLTLETRTFVSKVHIINTWNPKDQDPSRRFLKRIGKKNFCFQSCV